MYSAIPPEISARFRPGLQFLGREKFPVGKSGNFWFLVSRCELHPEALLKQRQDSYLRGQNPCAICAELERPSQKHDYSTVVQKCTAAHEGRFNYGKIVSRAGKRDHIEAHCPEGHNFLVDIGNHLYNGVGCTVCTPGKYTQESGEAALRRKYGDAYAPYEIVQINLRSYVGFTCPTHGLQQQIITRALAGKMCPQCGLEGRTAKIKQTRERFLEKLTASGSSLKLVDGTFAYATAPAQFICENGHITEKLPYTIGTATGCSMCSSRVSLPNKEIALLLGGQLEVKVAPRITVDVLLPEQKLIVEYHGHIWHSDRYNLSNSKHLDRMRQLQGLGYRYIQIFQDEWEYKRPQCEALLRRAAGQDASKTVGARSLILCQLTAGEAREFFSNHHIQGFPVDTSKVFALRDEAGPKAAIAFTSTGSHRSQLADGEYELSRFATVGKVAGGFSRLFNYAKQQLGFTSVRTLSDNRLFTGNVYQTVGFTKEADVAPDYKYTDGTRRPRVHKSQMQKSQLAIKHPELDLSLPEQQLTRQLGFYRVYDAGKVLWRWRQT